MKMKFLQKSQFDKVRASQLDTPRKLALIAKMCRLNTLFEVKRAGSGHLGSSFSAMDIVVFLYHHLMNVRDLGINHKDRDIYFSSKGHDVPGQYSVLHSLGILSDEMLINLRRLCGLHGHPDISIDGIEANTGSLGMGISKGRGVLFAKRKLKSKGKVIVMTGDGEFQEGQNFEALQSTVQQKANELIVVMDHNKLQSDRSIDRIVSLGNLDQKFAAFGWHVARCDGHDFEALDAVFKEFEDVTDKPKILICDTIKGRGVSFMEHPRALQENNDFYKWHAGAPDDASYSRAYDELEASIRNDWKSSQLGEPEFFEPAPEAKTLSNISDEVIANAYGKALVTLAPKYDNFIVLDADLSLDCKLREFEDSYPDRFVECGIAEQDMISMAAGIALQGMLPIAHSFANFMAARANEQIYNALGENKKMIFSCHYAGLIPAGPGKSHQSTRDISLFTAFPNCTILQACNSEEMHQIVEYAIKDSKESCMIRINIGPSPQKILLPKGYKLSPGKGISLTENSSADSVLFSYGPVMLHEAIVAHETLLTKGVNVRVVNMPWLNRFDETWLRAELNGCKQLFILEDHSSAGGLGDRLRAFFSERNWKSAPMINVFGVDEFPACGTPREVLQKHHLDGQSIAGRILECRAL